MLVKCKMKSDSDTFFKMLESSAKDELTRFGKMDANVDVSEGLAYSKIIKRGKKSSRIIVKISKFEPGRLYQTRIKNDDGQVSKITYVVEPLSEGGCYVTYEECLEGEEASGLHKGLRIWIVGIAGSLRVKSQFKLIDKNIQKQLKAIKGK